MPIGRLDEHTQRKRETAERRILWWAGRGGSARLLMIVQEHSGVIVGWASRKATMGLRKTGEAKGVEKAQRGQIGPGVVGSKRIGVRAR